MAARHQTQALRVLEEGVDDEEVLSRRRLHKKAESRHTGGVLAAWLRIGLAVALFTGCRGTGHKSQSHDLAVPEDDFGVSQDLALGARDLAVAPLISDLAFTSADATGFCAMTSIDGTCVQAFFELLVECFVPQGNCDQFDTDSAHQLACWESGSGTEYSEEAGCYSPYQAARFYMRGNYTCMIADLACGTVETWTAADGTTLVVDTISGDATCADGTHVNVGPSYDACADLQRLTVRNPYLHPAALESACPRKIPPVDWCTTEEWPRR